MKAKAQTKTVLETILDWSQDRPHWQRDALRRIVSKGLLDGEDINELVGLCKQGKGEKNTVPQAIPLAKAQLPANPGKGGTVSLVSLTDIEGVNDLAPDQVLTFGQTGLTVIYGDNGAGKSGYARILKRACRARHAGKIEPNVYSQNPPGQASANISFSIGGVAQPPEPWQDSEHPHATLSAVSVFDSDCAEVHINSKNEVAFRPFGLDVPDELAVACQTVKDALNSEKKILEKTRNPIFLKPAWKETTAVGKSLASLSFNTDTKKLQALSELTEDDRARLARLKEDLAKDPVKAAAEQKLKADRIKKLVDAVTLIEERTADKSLSSIFEAHRDAAQKREAARIAAEKVFSGDPLPGVGGDVWRTLWESARAYSWAIAYPDNAFPPAKSDARCVLCQQPLGTEAITRMARFEEFIKQDTDRQAKQSEDAFNRLRTELASAKIRFHELKANLQEVALHNADLGRRTRRFLASARVRRHVLLKNLGTKKLDLPPVAPSPRLEITLLETTLRKYAIELQQGASSQERKKLETELAELTDRDLLGPMMQTVLDEVERLKGIHFLDQCLEDTTTNTITKVGNDIADSVITPRLRDRFQEEIVRLAADKVRVEIVRSGGKYGSPQYQIQLFAKPDAKVQHILSEGEKTCVALAAFLTELATATHQSTLVFDDPISSLDHRWRKCVARRLVEEAQHRQIIVFTHDLIFVNDLDDLAFHQKVPVRLATVSRGPSGAGNITQGLPWKGKGVEDRLDKLEKSARDAKKLYDSNDEEQYERDATAVYNNLRASWERTLEEIVFFRVVQRHRDYIDTKNLKKVTVLTEADCDIFHAGFKKCSDIVDAHDPSGGRNAQVPAPNEMLQDIQALKDWVDSLRDRQKQL